MSWQNFSTLYSGFGLASALLNEVYKIKMSNHKSTIFCDNCFPFYLSVFLRTYSTVQLRSFGATPSIPEIIWVKNVRAIVVCGFLMKSLKKHILKIWKKSWVPFGRYLLNSTANPAHFHSNWAESAVLSSR